MASRMSFYSRPFFACSVLAVAVFGEGVAAAAVQPVGQIIPPGVPAPPANSDLPDVETVIPVSELQADVPSLPPAQDGRSEDPLSEMREFEQRLSAPLEVEGVAPGVDPELNQPLPLLEQFDARPIEFAEPARGGDATEIRYVTRIEGLDAVNTLAVPNLTNQFDDLSALRESDGRAANEAMLQARLTQDAELLRTILESQGWYSAKVGTRIDQPATTDGSVVARLSVAPGERYRLGSINVLAGKTLPQDLITRNFPIEVGEPIIAARVQAAEATLQVALPQNGYPFAKLGQRDILLDPDTYLGDYSLPLDAGPLARFNGIRTTGDLAFGVEHVRTIARFKRGELYDSRMVDDLRQALIATGLFTTVAVEPERTNDAAADGAEFVTLVVTQNAGPPRTLAASAGYGTGQGFLLQGSWTHRNFFRPEGALIASAVVGTKEQGASFTFRRSNAGKRDRTFQVVGEARRARYDAFDALTARVAARLSYDSTPIWRKPFTWAAGAEILGTVEKAFDLEAGERRQRK